MGNIFEGKTIDQVNLILEVLTEQQKHYKNLYMAGYEHGKFLKEAGFDLIELPAETHDIKYSDGFEKGFKDS